MLLRLVWRTIAVIDLTLFTLLMVALAILPAAVLDIIYPPFFQAWCRTFVRALGIELRVHQHYRGSLPDPMVLIANHPSAFEDIAIPALFRVHSLAKAEVADWWLVGRIARAAGTLFVKRESGESRKAAARALSDCVRSGKSIALYPEGGCKGRRLSGHFFNGAFATSFETGVFIVPVYIHYEAQEGFEWGDQHLLTKIYELAKVINPRANIHIHEPINPGQFESADALKAHVYQQYLDWQSRYLD